MFEQGSLVVYGIHGVCKVADLESRAINGKKVEYYVLKPLEKADASFLIPTQNPAAVSKMRPILTKEKLEVLFSRDISEEDVWIGDENHRKQRYRELITGSDIAALICMVRAIHNHKEVQAASGKKLHQCDEYFLRDAERLLSSELSLILHIAPDAVGQYVKEKIDANRG